ncbi:hypothetical protein NQ176_g6834 [Zarea fungicola]|uniref:Uncharacterized protein n=1 Tax=Zarea fungicola TaxID=93591 RepID=A0ACC1N3J4_9HYPO|nr:hypothetical protein NQ176_g6834 [Lecanicillium fungicola]
MRLPVAVIASIAPTLAYANGGVDWSFPEAVEKHTRLQDITFGFNMLRSPHASGFYFAQQFKFYGFDDVAYTGIQPRPDDAEGRHIVHAVFSSFIKGTTTTSPLCKPGANGGPGVSCAIDFVGNYTHGYECVVTRGFPKGKDDGRTWQGYIVDAVTGESREMGEWTLPGITSGIEPHQLGFVDYYEFNGGPRPLDCSTLPKVGVSFFAPTSGTKRAGPGILENFTDYGDCESESNFSATEIPNGVHISIGF